MPADISDVAGTVVPPKYAEGKSISLGMTPDHCVSSFTLGVEYAAADDSILGSAPVEIGPGRLRDAIEECFDEAKAKADADGVASDHADYPKMPDAEQKWTVAQNKLNAALADEDISAIPTLEAKLAAVAEQLVDLLKIAQEDGAYPQKWGKRMLLNAYWAVAGRNR